MMIHASGLILAPGLGLAADTGTSAATTASGSSQPATTLQPLQGDLGHPYYLPQASRARMHQCAIEWQRMKLAGEADTTTWRIFASSCLVSQDDKTGVAPNLTK